MPGPFPPHDSMHTRDADTSGERSQHLSYFPENLTHHNRLPKSQTHPPTEAPWGLQGRRLHFLVGSFPREAIEGRKPPWGSPAAQNWWWSQWMGSCPTPPASSPGPLAGMLGGCRPPRHTPIHPHSTPTPSPLPPPLPRPRFPSCCPGCVLISDLLANLKGNVEFSPSRLLNLPGGQPGAHCILSQLFCRSDIFHHKKIEYKHCLYVDEDDYYKNQTSDPYKVKNILATKSLCGKATQALCPEAWFSICNPLVKKQSPDGSPLCLLLARHFVVNSAAPHKNSSISAHIDSPHLSNICWEPTVGQALLLPGEAWGWAGSPCAEL